MRLNGRGCPRDVTAGLQLLKNAAAGGSLYAAGLLALHYFTSKLFSKSTETALRYIGMITPVVSRNKALTKCSVCELQSDADSLSVLERKGMSLACFTLARSLQLGQAVSQDLDKAIQYFTKVTGFYNAGCTNSNCLLLSSPSPSSLALSRQKVTTKTQ